MQAKFAGPISQGAPAGAKRQSPANDTIPTGCLQFQVVPLRHDDVQLMQPPAVLLRNRSRQPPSGASRNARPTRSVNARNPDHRRGRRTRDRPAVPCSGKDPKASGFVGETVAPPPWTGRTLLGGTPGDFPGPTTICRCRIGIGRLNLGKRNTLLRRWPESGVGIRVEQAMNSGNSSDKETDENRHSPAKGLLCRRREGNRYR